MVSLTKNFNTNSGGVTFFSESENMDDGEYLHLISEPYGQFKPVNTIFVFVLHLLATLALQILAIVFVSIAPDKSKQCQEYFILIYCHIGLWLLTWIIDSIVRVKHRNLRLHGYLEFYKNTSMKHSLPMFVVSLAVSVMCIIQAVAQYLYGENFENKCVNGGIFSPIVYIFSLITIEFCIIVAIDLNYMICVWRFNKSKAPPDVLKDEWNACSTASGSFAQDEIGHRQHGDNIYNFIEKQADLIRHLKEHNTRLCEKLMILNAQRQSGMDSGGASTGEQFT